MSYAEEAEERWEAIHGPIMYWQYGASAPVLDPRAETILEEARDLTAAVEGLSGLMGEHAQQHTADLDGSALATAEARWERLDEHLRVLAAGNQQHPISLFAPDGRTYWVQAIDRS